MAKNFARYTLTEEQRKRFSEYARYDTLRRTSNGLPIPQGVKVPSEHEVGVYRDFMNYDGVLRALEDRGYATEGDVFLIKRGLAGTDFEVDSEFISTDELSMTHEYLAGLQDQRSVSLTNLLNQGIGGLRH